MGNSQTKKQESIEARHSVPLGLYPKCTWDSKTLKKLIAEKKLAPIFKGVEDPDDSDDLDECPICMLYYPGGLNRSICCKQFICTECFLQLKPPTTSGTCPFCNRDSFAAVFKGPKTAEERKKEEEERQSVLSAQLRMRQEEEERDREREKQREIERQNRQRQEQEEPKANLILLEGIEVDTNSGRDGESKGDPSSSSPLLSASPSSPSLSGEINYALDMQSDLRLEDEEIRNRGLFGVLSDNVEDLEDAMLREAIRLSLADQ